MEVRNEIHNSSLGNADGVSRPILTAPQRLHLVYYLKGSGLCQFDRERHLQSGLGHRTGAKELITKCLHRAKCTDDPGLKQSPDESTDHQGPVWRMPTQNEFNMELWEFCMRRLKQFQSNWDPAPTESEGPFPPVVLTTVIAASRAMEDVEREVIAHIHASKN